MTVPLPAAAPRRLKDLTIPQVEAALEADPRLLIPVGTTWAPSPDLPYGAGTVVAERLADDLSAAFGVLRAPTIEYGVNPPPLTRGAAPRGSASLRKKTLHRLLNDLLASWEGCGVAECILLTAHRFDPHQEALATVITARARVRVVDVFAVDLRDLLPLPLLDATAGIPARGPDSPAARLWTASALRALLRHLAPALVRGPAPDVMAQLRTATAGQRRGRPAPPVGGHRAGDPLPPPPESPAQEAERGARLYARLYTRIAERVLGLSAGEAEI
jgi:creatinine amidohydrolase